MGDFFELANRQRAHRAFTDDPVDDATIERLLAVATRAPSAENRQPWQFIVVRDSELRERLGDVMAKAWNASRAYSQSRLDPALFAAVDAGLRGGGVAGAPVLIVVCFDGARGHPATIGSSIFPAVQNLLLGATALGLGSALTTIATTHAAELRALLALPESLEPVAVVPVGHPSRDLGAGGREPIANHTHRDRYGQPW